MFAYLCNADLRLMCNFPLKSSIIGHFKNFNTFFLGFLIFAIQKPTPLYTGSDSQIAELGAPNWGMTERLI